MKAVSVLCNYQHAHFDAFNTTAPKFKVQFWELRELLKGDVSSASNSVSRSENARRKKKVKSLRKLEKKSFGNKLQRI